jgi:ABC-type sulfate/molybdate transport systems ATPase subunit
VKWDVAIRKTVGAGAQRFDLDVAFRSDVDRLVLFGPSGAGKTMTLKAIAGLVRPDAAGSRWPERRCSTPSAASTRRRDSATAATCSRSTRSSRT